MAVIKLVGIDKIYCKTNKGNKYINNVKPTWTAKFYRSECFKNSGTNCDLKPMVYTNKPSTSLIVTGQEGSPKVVTIETPQTGRPDRYSNSPDYL